MVNKDVFDNVHIFDIAHYYCFGLTVCSLVNGVTLSLFEALKLSNEARKTTTAGEIVNLMSIDVHRLQEVIGFLWMVWSSPLQILVAIYLLWTILGAPVLAGFGIMVVLLLANIVIAGVTKKLQVCSTVLFIRSAN